MEKFFDKLSLLFSGSGFTFGGLCLAAGNYWHGTAIILLSIVLLFAGITENKR